MNSDPERALRLFPAAISNGGWFTDGQADSQDTVRLGDEANDDTGQTRGLSTQNFFRLAAESASIIDCGRTIPELIEEALRTSVAAE